MKKVKLTIQTKQNRKKQQNMQHSNQQAEQSQDSIHTPPLVYRIKQYQASSFLSGFSYALIRPPRFMYNEQLLYPPQNYQIRYRVQHHEIPFKLTLYKTDNMMYVILYLHGNSSSRFQGYMQLRDLPDGVGLACFDFSGCGMRFQSDYISLGLKQSKDVDIAAKYLKSLGYKVVGWGRSMGSVSLLLSQQIDIMVADSPFYSLNDLCEQSSYSVTPAICCCFFHCFYPCLFACVRSDVQQKAGFDVRDLQVAKIVQNYPRNKDRSLFIMAGTQDSMIRYHHSQKIFAAFAGQKQLQLFSGTHNSNRPQEVLQKCYKFIQKQLGISRKEAKKPNVAAIRLKPISVPSSLDKQFQVKSKESVNREQTQQPEQLSRSNTKQKLGMLSAVSKKLKQKNLQESQLVEVNSSYKSNNFNTITTINHNIENNSKISKPNANIDKSIREAESMEAFDLQHGIGNDDFKQTPKQKVNLLLNLPKIEEKKGKNQTIPETSFQVERREQVSKQDSKLEERENSLIPILRRSSKTDSPTGQTQKQQIPKTLPQ